MYRLLVMLSLLGLGTGVCNPQGTGADWSFPPSGGSGGNGASVENWPWRKNYGDNSGTSANWPSWQRSGSNDCNDNAVSMCGNSGGISPWPSRGSSGRSWYGSSVEIASSEIARLLISASQKMDRFCTAHSDRALREVYGVEHFQLRIRLSEFTEDNIQVRVRQRLVSVHARSCSKEYAVLRILPDVVDAQRASWMFESGTLTIMFPYNVTPDTRIQSYCGRQISDGVIIVPKCAAGTVVDRDYDVSFNDANFKRVIRRYLQELAHEGNINDNSKEYIDDEN